MSKQTMPIDTQQIVDTLTEAGVPGQQARAHASVLNDALQDFDEHTRHQAVSRKDLGDVIAPINEQLAEVRVATVRLQAQIEELGVRVDALDTKISAVEEKFDAKFDAIDSKIDSAVSKLKSEVAFWIVSASFLQTTIIAALVLELAT